MRLTKEEARAYKGYALTPKQLIEKAKKFLYSTGTIKYIRKLKKKHTIAVTK